MTTGFSRSISESLPSFLNGEKKETFAFFHIEIILLISDK